MVSVPSGRSFQLHTPHSPYSNLSRYFPLLEIADYRINRERNGNNNGPEGYIFSELDDRNLHKFRMKGMMFLSSHI